MGMYVSLSARLAAVGINAMRLDYREPARMKSCVEDVVAGLGWLRDNMGMTGAVLAGWSFGGAVVITIAGKTNSLGIERALFDGK